MTNNDLGKIWPKKIWCLVQKSTKSNPIITENTGYENILLGFWEIFGRPVEGLFYANRATVSILNGLEERARVAIFYAVSRE